MILSQKESASWVGGWRGLQDCLEGMWRTLLSGEEEFLLYKALLVKVMPAQFSHV